MILIDIDGVCLNLLQAIKDRDSAFQPDLVQAYDFSKGNFGIAREQAFKYIKEAETFRLEKPYRGVKYGLNQLKTLDAVKAWTYVPTELIPIREKQLRMLDLEGIICKQLPKDKIVEDVVAIIEDNPESLKMYADTNVIRIMVRRSYNLTCKDYDYCVDNLKEAYKVLKECKVYERNRKSIFNSRCSSRNFFRYLQEKGQRIAQRVSSR